MFSSQQTIIPIRVLKILIHKKKSSRTSRTYTFFPGPPRRHAPRENDLPATVFANVGEATQNY